MNTPNLRALTALSRLRRIETDEARRALAAALAEEAALAARDAAIVEEIQQVRDGPAPFDLDMFAAWLGRMMAERSRLAETAREAATRTVTARADLNRRRVAETAAGDALAQATAERDAEFARREQMVLEDVARAMRRSAGRRGRTG
jgi:hypothetical protein